MDYSITKKLNYAWMSQASYLDFQGLSAGNVDVLKLKLGNVSSINKDKIFADEQINTFVASNTGYSFVSHQANTDSGFSATIFQSNADGSYTFAVRGTEPPASGNYGQSFIDLAAADGLGVVLQGEALSQLFDSYRYYKMATATGAYASYSQQELLAMASLVVKANDFNGGLITGALLLTPLWAYAPIATLVATWSQGLTFEQRVQSMASELAQYLSNDSSIGVAIPTGATINFTGHSLGGHVAALLAEMVANLDTTRPIGDILTYDAPGINAIPNEIINWFTSGTVTISSGILAKQVAIFGEAGLEVTSLLGQVNGSPQAFFIEDSGSGIGGQIGNHSIVKLSDSLAMYDLLHKLSPMETNAQTKLFLEQASNIPIESLEKTLDALRHIILGGTLTPTLITGDSDAAARTDYYKNIKALTDSTTFQSLIGKVTLVAPPTSATEARSDLGLFLSLYYLTPFALKTDGSIAADAQLTIANPDIATQFKDDKLLTPEQIANGEANFSDMYLADRALMLTWKNQLAAEDFVDSTGAGYQDTTQSYLLDDSSTHFFARINPLSTKLVNIQFGNDTGDNQSDTISAVFPSKESHIYGLGGNDTLSGGTGNDILLGGADVDYIYGMDKADILFGDRNLTGWQVANDNEWRMAA